MEMFAIPFMQKALVISLLIGGILAYLGVFIVLRRVIFIGFAISQISACGFAFGFLLGFEPMVASLIFVFLGICIFSFQRSESVVPRESLIGGVYVVSAALTVLFIAKSPQAESHMLNILSGNILAVTNAQIALMAVAAGAACLLMGLFYKKFIFSFFDPETAKSQKLKVEMWNFIFYALIGVIITISIQTAGILLTFAYMVLPASGALLISTKMKNIFLISLGSSLAAAFTGLTLSFVMDLSLIHISEPTRPY